MPLITFLDAILCPTEYPNLGSSDGNWNLDNETRVKAQAVLLFSFQTLAVFIITKYVLDEVKTLPSKLHSGIKIYMYMYEAYNKVTEVVKGLKPLKETIDTIFSMWYYEVLEQAESIGVSESIPRKTHIQRN